jgi:hypothetical protein
MAANERIAPVDEIQLLRAAACDYRLSRGDLGVFAVILEHCDADLCAFPGPALIARKARLSVTSVKNSIRQLEEWRYLKVERPGLRKRNRFQVLPSPTVLPRAAFETGQVSLTSSRLSKRGNWSRGVAQSGSKLKAPTGQAQQPPPGQARLHQLGKSARQEVAFKSPEKSQDASLSLQEQEDQDKATRFARAQEERERVRAEYLQVLETHPAYAARMLKVYPNYLHDLVPPTDKAA